MRCYFVKPRGLPLCKLQNWLKTYNGRWQTIFLHSFRCQDEIMLEQHIPDILRQMGWIRKHCHFLTVDVEEIGDSSILLNFHSQFLLNTYVAWTHIHSDSRHINTSLSGTPDDFFDSISYRLSTERIPSYIDTNNCFMPSPDTPELIKQCMVSDFIAVEI